MQTTPRGNRLHIAIFGRRNSGKSSLINALTGQEIALVSSVPGTTADPVYKAMEILPVGPCMLIDTAGIDDTGDLGELRARKARRVLEETDLAIMVIDPVADINDFETHLKEEIEKHGIPLITVVNKIDTGLADLDSLQKSLDIPLLGVSALTGEGIPQLKERIIQLAPAGFEDHPIAGDLINPGDVILLVVPIDKAAPKGRLILPQVQTIRDILDHGGTAFVTRDSELPQALTQLKQPPHLVITDSQVFPYVDAIVPPSVPLTSFSILFAHSKGDLQELARGAEAVNQLRSGDMVLIAEACTHHRQDDDIGRVKIPRLLQQRVGGLDFHWYSGFTYPENLGDYKLIIHCGGCMINRRQMLYRINKAREKGVPIVNYGVLLAFLHGILERSLAPFSLKNT